LSKNIRFAGIFYFDIDFKPFNSDTK